MNYKWCVSGAVHTGQGERNMDYIAREDALALLKRYNQDPFHLQDSTQLEMNNKLDLSNLDFNEILFATVLQYSWPPAIAQQDSVRSCRLPRSVIFRPPARPRCSFAWIPVVNGWSP